MDGPSLSHKVGQKPQVAQQDTSATASLMKAQQHTRALLLLHPS
ncbi:hypothetical protein CCACVL1_21451 [Corchorus capsularis]|uniref:Uncharacterized protein n=1 Tax=Corchorus capsularis TaxID=210143 RepID=A0A1R3H5Q9_COCAP|nr:hypothetical protein CCACVL1_21451 [Corchorus capsularis]